MYILKKNLVDVCWLYAGTFYLSHAVCRAYRLPMLLCVVYCVCFNCNDNVYSHNNV